MLFKVSFVKNLSQKIGSSNKHFVSIMSREASQNTQRTKSSEGYTTTAKGRITLLSSWARIRTWNQHGHSLTLDRWWLEKRLIKICSTSKLRFNVFWMLRWFSLFHSNKERFHKLLYPSWQPSYFFLSFPLASFINKMFLPLDMSETGYFLFYTPFCVWFV